MFISRVIFSIMLCLHMYLNEHLPSKIKTKQLLMVRVHLSRWYQFLPYEGRTRERGGAGGAGGMVRTAALPVSDRRQKTRVREPRKAQTRLGPSVR